MKKIKYLAFIWGSIFVSSCKDEFPKNISKIQDLKVEILIPTTAQKSQTSSLRVFENVLTESEAFAMLLATSLKDKDFRKFLKVEANKKLDGDFDILVSKVLDINIGNQKFSEKIKNNSPNGYVHGKRVVENAIRNPKLNIAIPLFIDKWDDANQLPLVAVAVGVDERTTKQLKAFDCNGEVYLIDARNEPNLPIIVINNNERMDYEANIKKNKNKRTSGNYEKVTWLQCPNLSEIESWYYGAPEIRFDAILHNNTFSSTANAAGNMEYTPSRSHASNGYTLEYWTAPQNLFIWNFDNSHGPNYFLQTFEIDDDGTTQSLTVGVSGGIKDVVTGSYSYNITYKAQDKKLKGELIYYSNPAPANIGDGSIVFTLEN